MSRRDWRRSQRQTTTNQMTTNQMTTNQMTTNQMTMTEAKMATNPQPAQRDRRIAGRSGTLTALLALCGALLAAPVAFAAAPKTVLIEGYAHTAAGPAVDGSYTMKFALYAGKLAATPFWQESGIKVDVKAGQFAYALGSGVPLDATEMGSANEVWLGITVDNDPELPRAMMHAVIFAMRAAIADVANGLLCTGCVKSSSLIWDADIDLAGQSLKALSLTAKSINGQSVVAQEFIGDGSKLSGIKLPTGSCPSGQAVIAINADGSLSCKKLTQDTPTGSLEAISGGALSNEFLETLSAPTKKVPIPDNTGLDALSTVVVPDTGNAKSITITVDVENSDLSQVSMVLLPPDDKKDGYVICDPCGNAGDKIFQTTVPAPTALKTGDLSKWIGANPKGTWNLKVKDSGYCIPQLPGNSKICDVAKGTDGWINDWSVTVTTVSDKDVAAKGQLVAYGGIRVGGTSAPCVPKISGSLRYLDGVGLQLCDGSAWSSIGAPKANPRFIGTCTSNGSSSTYGFCLNQTIIDTGADYWTVTATNSGSTNDFNVGRVLMKKPGLYKFSFDRRARGSSCQWWMYKSGNQVAYGYQNDGYTTVYVQESGSRTMQMNANDYFNLKFNCNNTAWYANDTVLEVERLGD